MDSRNGFASLLEEAMLRDPVLDRWVRGTVALLRGEAPDPEGLREWLVSELLSQNVTPRSATVRGAHSAEDRWLRLNSDEVGRLQSGDVVRVLRSGEAIRLRRRRGSRFFCNRGFGIEGGRSIEDGDTLFAVGTLAP